MRQRMCNHCKQWAPVHAWEEAFGCPCCGLSNHIPKTDYRVIGDIQPYRSMVTGEEIGGRRQHREHLRQHNLIEIGNERIEPKPIPRVPGLKEDILRAYHQQRNKR